MSETNYLCPECRAVLNAESHGEFDTWVCPAGHGVGMTISEAYERLQEDEIEAIWQASSTAPTGPLRSPLLGRPMVAVTVLVDEDEIPGNEGEGARLVTLDVCREERFLWFEVVDLQNMPADLPDPEPTPEELARLDAAAESVRKAVRERLAPDAIERIAYRFGSAAAATTGLDAVTRRLMGRRGRG